MTHAQAKDGGTRNRHRFQAHHDLGFQRLVGQSLGEGARVGDAWVARLGWGSAALKRAPRYAWIGWTPSLKSRRLHLLANQVRFLILPAGRVAHFSPPPETSEPGLGTLLRASPPAGSAIIRNAASGSVKTTVGVKLPAPLTLVGAGDATPGGKIEKSRAFFA